MKLTSDPGEAGTAGMRFSVTVYAGLLSEEVTAEPQNAAQILQDRQLLPSRAACKVGNDVKHKHGKRRNGLPEQRDG